MNSMEGEEGVKEEEEQENEEPDGEDQEEWVYRMAMTDEKPEVEAREWVKPSRKMRTKKKEVDITRE